MTDIFQYNDNSMLTSGPYKFTRLINVPAVWLLGIYNKDQKSKIRKKGKHSDRQLIDYIERNLESIKNRVGKPIEENNGFGHRRRGMATIQLTCGVTDKLVFVSEKDARDELKKVKDTSSDKKPVRFYECEHCSGWHLTSIPYDVWKERRKNEKRD